MGQKEITGFKESLCGIFEGIEGELPQIQKAAKVITDAYEAGRMVHVIGPGGHSNLGVEEILWRAGGLAIWDAILDPGTNLIHGAKRSLHRATRVTPWAFWTRKESAGIKGRSSYISTPTA